MNTCEDCGLDENETVLWIVSADYGTGAFLAVLCEVCDAKRQAAATRPRRPGREPSEQPAERRLADSEGSSEQS